MLPKTFIAKDGRKVIIRPPRWEDLEGLMKYINSLIEVKAEIVLNEKVTREEEAEWLAKILVGTEKGEVINVVAEAEDEIVAGAEVNKQKHLMSHVGILGIGVKSGFRGIEIGNFIRKR